MSVIIKGMEMPPKCEWLDENHNIHRCSLLDDNDDCKLQNCDPYWSWYEQYEGCPLIEIPKGARLIDAKGLYMDIIHRFDYCDDFLEMLENAPTIFNEDKE